MKQTIFKIVLATVMLLGTTGCGDKKVSTEDRKVAFDTKINTLKNAGFDINQSQEGNYILHINNSKKAALTMLSLVDMATLDAQALTSISEVIDGARIGIEVDWNKYGSNAERSVFIYYIGNGKEIKTVQKMLLEKKIGAYLSFDENDALIRADIKDIDEKLSSGSDVIHLSLKSAGIKIDETATKDSPLVEYVLNAGEFNVEVKEKDSKVFALGYKDLSCSIARTAPYLGKWNCKFPLMQIDVDDDGETVSVAFKDTMLEYMTTLNAKKIKADILFVMPNINIEVKDGEKDITVHLKDLKIAGNSDNADETLIKEIYKMAGTAPKDHNETFTKYMKLVGELMGSGVTYDFKMSLASIDGKATEDSNVTRFMLKDYEGEAKGSLDKTINYTTSTKIKLISAKQEKANTLIFELKGFKFGYEIKDLYNFFPVFMEFAAMTANKSPDDYQLSKEEQQKMTAIGHQIVNGGLGLSFSPVGIDSMMLNDGKNNMSYEKIDLSINATLVQNTLKLDSPMAAMMLLQYLQADGRLELSKKDLDQMSASSPPQMMAIVMVSAKYEGDKAVFVIKFEKGRLMVNGKPVM
ncbi:MAG: YdgA family protein [Sulfurovum sp.]|nr:YdgA family protein [Sulfurovum sp.]